MPSRTFKKGRAGVHTLQEHNGPPAYVECSIKVVPILATHLRSMTDSTPHSMSDPVGQDDVSFRIGTLTANKPRSSMHDISNINTIKRSILYPSV